MDGASSGPPVPARRSRDDAPADGWLFGAFYLLEGAASLLAVALYKYHDRLDTLSPRQALVLLAPLAAVIAASSFIGWTSWSANASGRRRFGLALTANLLSVTLLVGAAEVLVRLLAVDTVMGPSFAGTLLLPRSWERQRARNAALLKRAPNNISYFVPDTLLGWTVGPSRRSSDGMYLSSTEGIRSPQTGMSYRDEPTRRRIATVGDSFTFGLESSYDETWQVHLGRSLGTDVSVLNFGVDGHGIDQAYLRYRRDVRPRNPEITILGFIDHDIVRAMSVYTFLAFPAWGMPFSKPRFDLRGDRLALLNVPVISPERMLEAREVADLPLLEHERGFNREEWEPRAVHASYLLRYIVSRFPRWPAQPEMQWTERALALNRALILAFARDAASAGTLPLVVYFPTRGDFEGLDRSATVELLAAASAAGIRHLDLTSCIGEIGPQRAFRDAHQHYSAEGNAAVARCLAPPVRDLLARGGPREGPGQRSRR